MAYTPAKKSKARKISPRKPARPTAIRKANGGILEQFEELMNSLRDLFTKSRTAEHRPSARPVTRPTAAKARPKSKAKSASRSVSVRRAAFSK